MELTKRNTIGLGLSGGLRFKRSDAISPSIMESIDYPSFDDGQKSLSSRPSPASLGSLPDVTLTTEFTSLKLGPENDAYCKSYLLLDGKENMKVSSKEQFLRRLGCDASARVKVVSVFGNTGDGKSHTLNQTFFDGEEVFHTSSEQDSCTLGVWVAFDPKLKVICLDTEGLLGSTNHEHQRTRLLLKVLAISDVVIYRTTSDRLHRDLFTFLGWASQAYTKHFQSALQSVGQRGEFGSSLSALGPAVIIFHETRHTQTLQSMKTESAEDILRNRFAKYKLDIEAFSSLKYIGIKTERPPTNYSELKTAIQNELENTTVRSARHPQIVYSTLKALNDKFSGDMANEDSLLPDQYFTCSSRCLCCDQRCESSMGHLKDDRSHSSNARCRYQHQFENVLYICKTCYSNGKEVVVKPKVASNTDTSWLGLARFAWSGYVIECSNCGEIYRSRQFWYGNKGPEDKAVRTEIQHVWPGSTTSLVGTQNAAQRVLDGVSYVTQAVASVSSPPTRLLTSWVADQIAPKYWRPNHEIKNCGACKKVFGSEASKHHCRSCGEGFCEDCSTNTRAVPDRGWLTPVRVCDTCYTSAEDGEGLNLLDDIDDTEVRVRKYGEAVVSTLSTVASVLEYPRGFIKDSVRPTYWVPDHEVKVCCCCTATFGPRLMLHHCRDCGHGVCESCSTGRRQVLRRGWDQPVRVCDQCLKQD